MKISRKQAKPILDKLFPDYTGRKISVSFSEKMRIYDTNWSGGSRREHKFIFSNGNIPSLNIPAPWNNTIEGSEIEIPENLLIVVHTFFCGSDCGITIYANPVHERKFLPE
jgi:hypothetical protein